MDQLAKVNLEEIRKSARHKTLGSYSSNEKDNATVMALLEASSDRADLLLLVPKWKPTCVDNHENSSLITSLIRRKTKRVFTSLS